MNEPALEDRQQGRIHLVARIGLAFVFAYHGLVPKLLIRHADEMAMLKDSGITSQLLITVLIAFGAAELVFALLLLLFWNHRWPQLVCIGFLCLRTVAVAAKSPRYLGAAFNPITLNLAIGCLASIDLLVLKRADYRSNVSRGI